MLLRKVKKEAAMKFIYLMTALLTFGCMSIREEAFNSKENFHVLVVDTGIDPTIKELKDKVIGSYTLTCNQIDMPAADLKAGYEKNKTAIIDYYKRAALKDYPDGCMLREGINPPNKGALLPFVYIRKKWNQAIASGNLQGIDKSQKEKLLTAFRNYHGTIVSSIIARENPHVKLVLVQVDIGMNPSEKNLNLTANTGKCMSQESINLYAKLMSDDDVRNAYVRVSNNTRRDLLKVIKKHKVSLVNMSLIKAPTYVLGTVCHADYQAFVKARTEAEHERDIVQDTTMEKMGVLTFQAAGNFAARINGYADQPECIDSGAHHKLVGSYDYFKKRSSFSNYGDCVGLYYLGKNIIGSAPNDFLAVISGTSLSTPLLIRHITSQYNPTWSIDQIKSDLDRQAKLNERFIEFSPQLNAMTTLNSTNGKKLSLNDMNELEEIWDFSYLFPSRENILFDPW